MGNIDEEGFLSNDINKFSSNHYLKYKKEFDFYRGLNSFAQSFAFKMSIPKRDLQKLALTALYIRSLSLFQSIYLLIIKGILDEAKILLRTQFEILFQIVAIAKNSKYGLFFFQQEFIHRKKMLKKINYWNPDLKQKITDEELSNMFNEMVSEIKDKKIKELSTFEYAKKADLIDFYNTGYVMLSFSTHANIMDISKHLIYDENGIKSFKWGPNDEQIFNIFITSIENKIIILENLNLCFSTNLEKEIKDYSKKFKTLFGNLVNPKTT